MTQAYFWVPIVLYFAGWIGEFARFWSSHARTVRISGGLLAVGWGAHTILLAALVWNAPVRVDLLLNMASWLSMVLYYLALQRVGGSVLRLVFPPLALALLITAYFSEESLLSAQRDLGLAGLTASNLLFAHIIAVIAGTLLFGLACLASIVYLVQERRIKAKLTRLDGSRLPSLATLAKYNHGAISLGFFCLTVGILLGLVVAGLSTLPHRLFSLRQLIPIGMWLVYALYLLVHDLQGWRGRFGAIWSIAGFFIVVGSLIFEILTLTTRA